MQTHHVRLEMMNYHQYWKYLFCPPRDREKDNHASWGGAIESYGLNPHLHYSGFVIAVEEEFVDIVRS
jgi:hypothetical protein